MADDALEFIRMQSLSFINKRTWTWSRNLYAPAIKGSMYIVYNPPFSYALSDVSQKKAQIVTFAVWFSYTSVTVFVTFLFSSTLNHRSLVVRLFTILLTADIRIWLTGAKNMDMEISGEHVKNIFKKMGGGWGLTVLKETIPRRINDFLLLNIWFNIIL